LDKAIVSELEDNPESKIQLDELKKLFMEEKIRFDLVLTNPPFSMDYSENLPNEKRILQDYELLTFGFKGTSKKRKSIRSTLMFLERYYDVLKVNGRLITVMDDSILSSPNYKIVREWVRQKFVVRAIISLHGDAFQRVGARAKTSLMYLIKRSGKSLKQPDVFMYESRYIGLDDVAAKTPPSIAEEALKNAQQETNQILKSFNEFLDGKKSNNVVSGAAITDRLDVKYCLPRSEDVAKIWEQEGYLIFRLEEIVDVISEPHLNPKDEPDESFTLLKITYTGLPQVGETRLGREITYNKLVKIQKNDLVLSNITASYGSTAVITKEYANLLTSSEFTILRIKDNRFKPYYLWGLLRSDEIRARLLSQTTGIGRQRVKWDFLSKIPIPLLRTESQNEIVQNYRKSFEYLNSYEQLKNEATEKLNEKLDLDNEWAKQRLIRAKPPK